MDNLGWKLCHLFRGGSERACISSSLNGRNTELRRIVAEQRDGLTFVWVIIQEDK